MRHFNPTHADQNIHTLTDALHFAATMIEFAAFLRNRDPHTVRGEIDRFFTEAYIGPITLTARRIATILHQIWHYNTPALTGMLGQRDDLHVRFLLALMNEVYLPAETPMPPDYALIRPQFRDTNTSVGLADRRQLAARGAGESLLLDGIITTSEKHVYHLDSEFSIYDIEYTYRWKTHRLYTADSVKLNTAHLRWANHGGLLHFPKIDRTEMDLDAMFAVGKPIQVFVAQENGCIRNPVYDDFVYDVAKM